MIHFNELYIDEDGKHLIIDAEIDNLSIYDKTYIESIKVDIGEYCEKGGNSEHAVTVYTGGQYQIGDLDDDNKITAKDIKIWDVLRILSTNKLLVDEALDYYYETTDWDEDDNPITVRIYLKDIKIDTAKPELGTLGRPVAKRIATLANYIKAKFDNAIIGEGQSDHGIGIGRVINYIYEILGEKAGYFESSTYGDLNNDGEVSVADFTYFVDFLKKVQTGEEQPLINIENDRHVILCLDSTDLSPLVEGKDLSKYLFIVTATANFKDNAQEVTLAGCGYDKSTITGLAYDGRPLYNAAISHASSYGDTCDTKDAANFVDFLMRYYGFLFAVKCGDLCQAQYYWSNYLMQSATKSKFNTTPKPCGCHGIRW